MAKAPVTIDFAALLCEDSRPAQVTLLEKKDAYKKPSEHHHHHSSNSNEKKSVQKVIKEESTTERKETELVQKLVARTSTYHVVVGDYNEDNHHQYLNNADGNNEFVAEMVQSIVHQAPNDDWNRLDPKLHEVSLGNWQDQIQWEGLVTNEEKESNDGSGSTDKIDVRTIIKPEESTAAALLAERRNPYLDNLVLDHTNISWEGSKEEGLRMAQKIPLILELGTAGASIARNLLPVSRPVPFDQTDEYMRRIDDEWAAPVVSTADIGKSGSLTENKEAKERYIEARQKKRAQMAKDKTNRVTEALSTLKIGAGKGRTITSSLMGPGGTERTGRPARGNTGSTEAHDSEYTDQLDLLKDHAFCKPELTDVELRQWQRPKLPKSFVRRDRPWQLQIRVPPKSNTKSAANPSLTMVYTGHTESGFRTEADLNPSEGKLVLLEYCEERPPVQLTKGMASKIVNYYRGDKARCPVSAGGGDRPTRRKRADNANESSNKKKESWGKVERPPRMKEADQAAKSTLEDWMGKAPKKKRDDGENKPSINVLPEGVSEILHPKDHGPFLGAVEDGVTQTGIITNMFAAPLFRHEPEATDFLMILGKRPVSVVKRPGVADKMSVILRALPSSVFTVGQVEPRKMGVVNSPQSTQEGNFQKLYIPYQIARQLTYYERHEQRGLRFDEIVHMFANSAIANTPLRAKIKMVAEFDKNSGIWELKPVSMYDGDDEYRGVEALGRRIHPEEIAAYFTAFAAARRLQDIGIHELYRQGTSAQQIPSVTTALMYMTGQMNAAREISRKMKRALEAIKSQKSNVAQSKMEMYEKAVAKLEEHAKELRQKQEVASFIYEELCLAPWHLTSEFIDVHKNGQGPGMMQLTGLGDPSGGQGGFSFLRDKEKSNRGSKATTDADAAVAAQVKKITGTENDLRKLTMKQMAAILRSFNMPQTKIDTLKRWDRVHVIRDLSTKAASDGMGDGLERFARGEKMKLSEQKQVYEKRIQEIFRRQRTALSVSDMRLGGQGDGGADLEDGVVTGEAMSPTKQKKEGITETSDDDDSDNDDLVALMEEEFEDDKTGSQLLMNQRREGGKNTPLGLKGQETSQDQAKDARDLVALRRQREEEKAAQDGLITTGRGDNDRSSMIGMKVVRQRITKMRPDGRQETKFKFVLAQAEVDRVLAQKHKTRKKKQIHKPNDRIYGHAMFEDDDNYELDYLDYNRSRTKGRGGAKTTKVRRPTKIKSKAKDQRLKKRKKELEEAELYEQPTKRKAGNNRRGERGAARHRMPHVIFAERLEKIRLDVERFDTSRPFARPVDRRKFPQYYEKISDPIDLQTIRDKNSKYEYKIAESFLKDFLLMKNNAEKFNGVNHNLAREASRIYEYVKQTIEGNRDELTAMEVAVEDQMTGKKKKKKKNSTPSTAAGNSGQMIDGMVIGDNLFSDESDSDDSGTELVEIG